METRVRERLIGAFVLVAIVVLFVPALLKGPERITETADVAGQRSREFPVPPMSEPATEETLMPEQSVPESTPAVVAEPLPQAASPPAVEPVPEIARPAAPEPVAAAVEVPTIGVAPGQPAWAVQLGAFSTREKAETLVAQLRRRGYAAFILEYRADGKVLHRVRVGPEQDRQRAAAIADRLRNDGFQPVVAPHP